MAWKNTFGIVIRIKVEAKATKPPNKLLIEIKKRSSSAKSKQSKNEILEGCLSLPHYYGPLKREALVKLKYQDEKGNEIVEEFKGEKLVGKSYKPLFPYFEDKEIENKDTESTQKKDIHFRRP